MHRSVIAAQLLLTVLLGGASACNAGGSELIVSVRSDLEPGLEFDAVETALFPGGSRLGIARTFERGANRDDDFVEGETIAEFVGVPPGAGFIRIRLLDRGVVVLTRNVTLDVRGSIGVTVVMTRACLGVECPAAEGDPMLRECLGARCVESSCAIESPEGCGSPECMADAECAAPGGCASPLCIGGTCVFAPSAEPCPDGEICDPERGCMTAPTAGSCEVCGVDGTCTEACAGDCVCPRGCDCDFTCVGPCQITCYDPTSSCRIDGNDREVEVVCDSATCVVEATLGSLDCRNGATCAVSQANGMRTDCDNTAFCCIEGAGTRMCGMVGGCTCNSTNAAGEMVQRCGTGCTCERPIDPGCSALGV